MICAANVGSTGCLQAVGTECGLMGRDGGLAGCMFAAHVSRKSTLFAGSGAAVCRPLHLRI
jgi:hypothetical protein